MEANAMTAVFTTITSVVTNAITWIGQFVDLIMDTPLFLLFICLPLVGLAIGLIKRMISL